MPLMEHWREGELEGVRAGRFPGKANTSSMVFRLGPTLIECGPPNQWRALRPWMAENPPRRLIVTHHHEDHSGNAEPVRRAFGCEVLAPRPSLERLAEGFRLRPYQRLIWGKPERCREARALSEQTRLDGGYRLRALPAPGHSFDMTCLLEPERGWLFAADLYIASRPRFLRADEDIDTTIETLGRVCEVDFRVLLCGHRGLIADGPAALRRKLDYLLGLRAEVRELAARGHGAKAIRNRLLGREEPISLITLGHFSKLNLIRSCLNSDPP